MVTAVPSRTGVEPIILPAAQRTSFPARWAFKVSSTGCTAKAPAPPTPTQNKFSLEGRCVKSITNPLTIALMPVCSGVGGGPAGVATTCSKESDDALAAANGADCAAQWNPQAAAQSDDPYGLHPHVHVRYLALETWNSDSTALTPLCRRSETGLVVGLVYLAPHRAHRNERSEKSRQSIACAT